MGPLKLTADVTHDAHASGNRTVGQGSGMSSLPSIFDCCKPRREVLQGELPDAIFAAELWDVFTCSPNTHADYREPVRFFAGTHPSENIRPFVQAVAVRLAASSGGTAISQRR